MLSDLSKQVAHCYSRPAECSAHAAEWDPDTKEFYVQRKKAWLSLAQSYELSERIGLALDERQRQRLRNWPATIEQFPSVQRARLEAQSKGRRSLSARTAIKSLTKSCQSSRIIEFEDARERAYVGSSFPAFTGIWRIQLFWHEPSWRRPRARGGPMTTKGSVYRWLRHIALLRRMGPRRRGDDSGESLLQFLSRERRRLTQ